VTHTHVLSALLGSALATAAFVLLSMSQVLPAGQHVIVNYGPSPRDMLQIRQGTPYVVPAGRVFVLTGFGTIYDCDGLLRLAVNGQEELSAGIYNLDHSNGTSVAEVSSVGHVPLGFTVAAGSTITINGGCGGALDRGRAWGYLADQ
jgi:hypothetical protein